MKLCTKRSGLFTLILFTVFFAGAQNPSYDQLVSIISSKLPGVSVSGKIIGFTAWSATNVQSRELNKEFDRVGIIYGRAKLKNGEKGTIVISCNTDNSASAVVIADRDGITFSIRINKSEFAFLSGITANSNVMYDATSAKVYENLAKEAVFMSYNQLVTR